MKVYVDELPKSCGDCIFCKQTEYYYYCDKLHTKLDYIDREKECPLKSLTEHNKAKDHQIQLLNKRWEMFKKGLQQLSKPLDTLVVDNEELHYIYTSDLLDMMEVIEKTDFEVAGNFKKGTIEVDDL